MLDSKLIADDGGVVLVLIRAAAFGAARLKARRAIQPHRDAETVISRLLHQQRGDGAVHAAAHGDHGVLSTRQSVQFLLHGKAPILSVRLYFLLT